MKKITSFIALFLLISCGVEYDGETRLVLETDLEGSDGNPLPGIPVSVAVGYDYLNGNVISNGVTDKNGKLILIFPSPVSDSVRIKIAIMPNDIYQTKTYQGLFKSDFQNYKFVLSPLRLYKLSEITSLSINYNQVNIGNYVTNVRVEGLLPEENITFHQESAYSQVDFSIIKNQNFVLKYEVVFNAEVTQHAVNLSVADDPINYTISF